jgi:hypothetical protein
MAEPILQFPRVITRDVDPQISDDSSKGFITGNIWVNQSTGAVFMCVYGALGKWVTVVTSGGTGVGGNVVLGDGVDSDVTIDSGDGCFRVDANNIELTCEANIKLAGDHIEFDEPNGWLQISRAEEPDQYLGWMEAQKFWGAGFQGIGDPSSPLGIKEFWPLITAVVKNRNPTENDYSFHYVGQVWLNYATHQKFTCVSTNHTTQKAIWRLALSSAPTKFQVESDDFIILYGQDDDTFTKIHITNFLSYLANVISGIEAPPSPFSEYGWVSDISDDVMPSDEIYVSIGMFELDAEGDLMPLLDPETASVDYYYDLDGNGDIQPLEYGDIGEEQT